MQVGPGEILVIMIVALLVFGPQRLPEVGRQVGAAVRELRRMQDTVRGELDMVLHPEHGTRTADETSPTATGEPGDHTALESGDVTSVEVQPADDPTSGATAPATPPDPDDDDGRFGGPPGSFI